MVKIQFISLPLTLTLCKSSHLKSMMFSHSFCVCCIWSSLVTSFFYSEENLIFYTHDFSCIAPSNSRRSLLICAERNNRLSQILFGKTPLSIKPMHFSALEIHQKCTTGKCTTLTLSHSLSVPPVIRRLFTDHFVCSSLNSAVFSLCSWEEAGTNMCHQQTPGYGLAAALT